MPTYTLSGFQVSYDPSGDPIAVDPASLNFVVPPDQTSFSYTVIAPATGTELPQVTRDPDSAYGVLTGPSVPAGSQLGLGTFGQFGDVEIGTDTHTVLLTSGPSNTDALADFVFQVGGDPLDYPSTVAEAQALQDAVTAADAATGALAPGTDIPFASLANTEQGVANNIIDGTNAGESLSGAGPDEFIVGFAGDDSLVGRGGDDSLIGGDGADNLDGGTGNDFLVGGGSEFLIAGDFDDDVMEGGGGNDVFVTALSGSDTVDGGPGTDRLVLFQQTFNPGDPNVVYEVDLPNSYFGPSGDSTGSGTITNVENLEFFGDADIEFTGDAADNTVVTGDGDDVISTGGGTDTLGGGRGDDTYEGGAGQDTFIIGPGDNRIKDFTPGTDILETADLELTLGLTEAEFTSALQQAQDDGQGNALVTFSNDDSLLFCDLTADQVATVLEVQPAPPATPPDWFTPPAWATGDPHIVTFDEVGYDFHAIGEFVLARGTAGGDFADFEVQSRMGAVTDDQGDPVSDVSANVAVAARLGNGSQVMIDSTDDTPLSITGDPQTLADGDVLEAGADRIYREGDTYTVVFAGADNTVNDGDAQLSVVVRDGRLDVGMQVSEAMSGQVEGLLGDSDGNPDNDIARADGSVLERPLAFDDLYGQYRDDWRVDSEGESLFTYDAGESLAGFYDPDAPANVPSVDDFDPADVTAARDTVSNAGLEPGTVPFENAVLDFLLTNDESFIESSADDTAPTTEATGSAGTLDAGETRVTIDVALADADGAAIEGAVVNFTAGGAPIVGQTGAAAGDYEIALGSNTDPGRVDAQRGFEAGDADIGVGDALDVLRMAVGLDTSFGPAAPENLIAGDVDQSGDVSVGDALDVLRFAVGLETENAPKWVFLDEDQDLSAVDRDNVDYETGIDTGAIADGLGLEMTGVLLGDLSAQPEA